MSRKHKSKGGHKPPPSGLRKQGSESQGLPFAVPTASTSGEDGRPPALPPPMPPALPGKAAPKLAAKPVPVSSGGAPVWASTGVVVAAGVVTVAAVAWAALAESRRGEAEQALAGLETKARKIEADLKKAEQDRARFEKLLVEAEQKLHLRPSDTRPARPEPRPEPRPDPKTDPTPKTDPPDTPRPPDGATVAATEVSIDMVGRSVSVRGRVGQASWNASTGMLFVNFEGVPRTGFVAIAKKGSRSALDAAFGGDIGRALAGKTVRISGTISEFRERPQLEITRPDQVAIE